MQLVCILCQTVLPSTDQRFGKHMQEEHAMVAGNNLVRFLLACHFLNEPERALLGVRMEKRIEDHVKSEMEVSELEVLVLEQTKAPDAATSFSNQLLRAMAETKVEKPKIRLAPDQGCICKVMGTKLPFTPLSTDEERKQYTDEEHNSYCENFDRSESADLKSQTMKYKISFFDTKIWIS